MDFSYNKNRSGAFIDVVDKIPRDRQSEKAFLPHDKMDAINIIAMGKKPSH